MELTETQIRNLTYLKVEVQIEIMHTCADGLGLMSVKQYHEYSKIPKRTIYQHIIDEKLKTIIICGITFIVLSA
jgi:hypothetical protein